jgi:aspartate dehydrogenase
MSMIKFAVVGFGAIGQEMVRMLRGDLRLQLTQIVVPPHAVDATKRVAADLAPGACVLTALDVSLPLRPDLLAECAGHAAVMSHVVMALQAGIPCVVASVGALHEADSFTRLEAAAGWGRTRVQLIAGAVGGMDALAAARMGGLDRVIYVGRKPPRSWYGTSAEQVCALAELTAPCVVFHGSAGEAAMKFPKNANVAATVAFAGLGLERTEVELIADPRIERNMHRVEASGPFGRLEIQLENLPLPGNPKTSALAVYSLVRAVRNASATVWF